MVEETTNNWKGEKNIVSTFSKCEKKEVYMS